MGLWNRFFGSKKKPKSDGPPSGFPMFSADGQILLAALGTPGCGITSLLKEFFPTAPGDVKFSGEYEKEVTLDGTSCTLTALANPGEEYADFSIDQAKCFLVCFDLCSNRSFSDATALVHRIQRRRNRAVNEVIVLCGLKCDCEEKNLALMNTLLSKRFEDQTLIKELLAFVGVAMDFELEVTAFCAMENIEFFKVSSVTGGNVDTVFHRAMRKYDRERERQRRRQAARSTKS